MSAWVNGVLDLKCSLDVLKRAIANLMPQWADHIRVDPSGKLDMYRYHGAKGESTWKRKDVTVHLLLPGSGNPNFPTPPGRSADNDWGFAVGPDGKWQVYFADYNKGQAQGLANAAKAEVIRMRNIAIAKMKGYKVLNNTYDKDKGVAIIELEVDADQAKSLMQKA